MKTKKQVPYKKFKADMTKLIEYALTQDLYLGSYVQTNGVTVEQVCDAQKPCGAPACILGYAPAVFPRRFTYVSDIGWDDTPVVAIESKYGCDEGCIRALTGNVEVDYPGRLERIFTVNGSGGELTDIQVVKARLKAIQESNSYKELVDKIVGNKKRVF